MSTTLISSSSANSTTVRSRSLQWLALRTYFRTVSRLLPETARRQAERLFTTPPRYAGRSVHPVPARRETVVAGGRSVALWQAGPAAAPAVLLVHGWGGRGVQMGSFVAPLLAEGHRVVWVDLPGHGESDRGAVALPELVTVFEGLDALAGPFCGAVGHSFGAAALILALRRSALALERVVLIGAPASLTEYSHRFAGQLGISARVLDAMRRRIERRLGVRFDEIDRIDELETVSVPALFVHDDADEQVPFEHALRLRRHLAGARVLRTWGLGHYRILRDRKVSQIAAAFVSKRDSEIPEEHPELPLPAPVY
ncbi:MAG: alpha/beta fold hydrolase [Rhodocyclaceae bacterium]|nr:alpha/beta fold hydrolase [Rhodocyclaceae bacterium]